MLIDDILARGGIEWEDKRIKLLHEGIERDAVDICAHLLSHSPTSASSASIPEWARGVKRSTLRQEAEEISRREHNLYFTTDHQWHQFSLLNNSVISSDLSSSTALTSTNGPESVYGSTQRRCSSDMGHTMSSTDLCSQSLITDVDQHSSIQARTAVVIFSYDDIYFELDCLTAYEYVDFL